MVLNVALTHKTTYTYDRMVEMGPQVIRLRPAPHCRTPVLSYSLTVKPSLHFMNWQQDPFGNFLARVVFPEPVDHFSVSVGLVANMAIINPFDFFVEETAKDWPFLYPPALKKELQAYLEPEVPGPLLRKYLTGIDRKRRSTIDFLCDLNRQLHADVNYLIRMEPGVQTPEVTLGKASGSCRDSGWLLVQILRNLGLAARFVSGYLIQLTPDVKSLDGPTGTEVDFTDLHAWTEVYVPGAGWIGLDPTSGLLAGEGHIPLAATPHPISAAPITGAHTKAEVEFAFEMHVDRIRETPRVTKPYSDETWQAIADSGHVIDARLKQGDVRLSMGGEPTFVASDDMEGAEWNTAAVGPNKRRYADNLVRKLRERFAPGGLLHYGQGKWYPGEQLPRWAFALYWRNDGQPLWENQALVASETERAEATPEDALSLMSALTQQLGLPANSAVPAYEDMAYFMLVEQKLPINVTPETNKLEDPAERDRVMRVFDRGVTEVAGYVLPIQAWHTEDRGRRWVTERWSLRRDKLFLIPGDSPIGYRLPLGSTYYLSPAEYPTEYPRDPFSNRRALPERHVLLQRRRTVTLEQPTFSPSTTSDVTGSVRTALAVEPRGDTVCVFMPPLLDAEDYAALAAAVEEAAAATGVPVHIEGYPPPYDPTINVIKVTPDPGVIEVNIQPAHSWDEAVTITTGIYEDAHMARLSTEKFMLDGRHTGTGGGNHIVLGGATPADSPFLRRPDLLASIIAYWQNHPSLSYLFSGMFIGPTSQAPRVDEARHESLYELEIALSQVPNPGAGSIPPWLVDRIFRNLLVDVTGNTHRAEICIDKLYSPDGPTGRLGLIEFRSFEMPPHARMSLAQQLLLRALIVMFWEKPYRTKLVRWGTALHDRFMLPHMVWQDFADVVADIKSAGLPIELDWFRPHFEFRFPLYGTVSIDNVKMELRQALEPWHVLGEEGIIGGTARYVDSSLERVQVKLSGLTGERYVVACNGRGLPLTPTGTFGEFVAGVRYRAWWPPSALHPTIAPHVPLTFDIYDCWSGRSVAGCRYHVSHPGGRNFEVFPVNAYEAEGRRLARYEAAGHTVTPGMPRPAAVNPEYPMTLDLRWV
ncbi:MAG: transglutaminase family protein [Hyphomicrobiaceae bacterium]|nr:transglutaminase family protein [Hyphomicrobiaceae bacterium]